MTPLVVTRSLLHFPTSLRPLLAARLYATQTSLGNTSSTPQPKRKAVTAFNDDGKVPWGQLSPMEKAARTTQQSFNSGLIILGAVLTTGVVYVLYTEVFALDSKTNHFNYAVNQVKKDPRCTALLGDAKKISAYGEGGRHGNWRMARPIASEVKKDNRGTEHLIMHFNVEGPLNKGVVNLHMVKRPGIDTEFIYKYLVLDVQGHQRIWLENADASSSNSPAKKTKFFGVSWN